MFDILSESFITTAQYHTAYDRLSEAKKDFANATLPQFSEYLRYLTDHWARQHMSGTELFNECVETFTAWYDAIRLDNFGHKAGDYNE